MKVPTAASAGATRTGVAPGIERAHLGPQPSDLAERIFYNDVSAAACWHDVHAARLPLNPEHRMLLALLLDQLNLATKRSNAVGLTELCKDARGWLRSSSDAPFSARWICLHLRLDYRAMIHKYLDANTVSPVRGLMRMRSAVRHYGAPTRQRPTRPELPGPHRFK